jgi:hypothetical protein
MTMNTEDLLTPTPELKDAAKSAIESRLRFQEIQTRLNQQRETVARLSQRLMDLIAIRSWETAETREEASAARQNCAVLAEEYGDEQALLEAMEIALMNTEDEILSARKNALRIMRQDLDSLLAQPEGAYAA